MREVAARAPRRTAGTAMATTVAISSVLLAATACETAEAPAQDTTAGQSPGEADQ